MNGFGSNISRCHLCNHRDRSLQGDVPCGFPNDGVAIAVHANAGWCPDGRFGVRDRPAGLVVPAAGPVQLVQIKPRPKPWDVLHAMTMPTPADLAAWRASLAPNRREQLDQYTTGHPVRWDDFPAWASEFHDAISVRIGKPRNNAKNGLPKSDSRD